MEVKFQIGSREWPGLSKIMEETCELNVNIAKLMATNGHILYWGNVNLKEEIEKEMGDALAAIVFSIENESRLDPKIITARMDEKLALYRKWRSDGE